MEELDLSFNDINDDGVAMLIVALNSGLRTVTSLNLSDNFLITASGWVSLFNALNRYSTSNLKELHIGSDEVDERRIDDRVIISLAKALERNCKLTIVGLGSTNISTRGWNILTKSLCDLSSIDGIYSYSNHILQEITCSQDIPPMIDLLLQTTNLHGKMAARVKVIVFVLLIHKDSVSRLFGPMPVSILPSVIAWMGKDHSGFGALYSLVRSVPSLLENV